MPKEQWRIIKEFPDYKISKRGEVRITLDSYPRKAAVCPNTGYLKITFFKNKKKYTRNVAHLVAIAFIPNPNNYKCVNHKDGNKQNNNIENLEWCSHSQNNKHAYATGLRKADNNGWKDIGKATSKPIINNKGQIFASAMEAQRKLGINNANINKCLQGKYKQSGGYSWNYLVENKIVNFEKETSNA